MKKKIPWILTIISLAILMSFLTVALLQLFGLVVRFTSDWQMVPYVVTTMVAALLFTIGISIAFGVAFRFIRTFGLEIKTLKRVTYMGLVAVLIILILGVWSKEIISPWNTLNQIESNDIMFYLFSFYCVRTIYKSIASTPDTLD